MLLAPVVWLSSPFILVLGTFCFMLGLLYSLYYFQKQGTNIFEQAITFKNPQRVPENTNHSVIFQFIQVS